MMLKETSECTNLRGKSGIPTLSGHGREIHPHSTLTGTVGRVARIVNTTSSSSINGVKGPVRVIHGLIVTSNDQNGAVGENRVSGTESIAENRLLDPSGFPGSVGEDIAHQVDFRADSTIGEWVDGIGIHVRTLLARATYPEQAYISDTLDEAMAVAGDNDDAEEEFA